MHEGPQVLVALADEECGRAGGRPPPAGRVAAVVTAAAGQGPGGGSGPGSRTHCP